MRKRPALSLGSKDVGVLIQPHFAGLQDADCVRTLKAHSHSGAGPRA